ncbi:unnamed protein product [Lactuca virosa]|uniref:Uncharacterized protein n=1 Tax=Lactuca virosa TaxID=75947 RepID=A0AAU9LXL6_9ASTR|nr:unnamed protein product [Lactuca virosa]
MKQDESVLKTLEKKTTQEIRQSPRLQKTKTKKSMKQDKSIFKTPEKKTTQEIRQSPRLKMIKYKKFVAPIKVDDSLVKKEFDEKVTDMKIHLPNAKIDITPELVHDLLGIPLGGKDIYNTDQCEGKELMDWKQQYNFKAMRPSDVEERIKESLDSGIIFRTNFLLLFVNTICEQNKPGTCMTTVLPHLLGKTPMREIDWCGFITNCLKMSKMTWDETDRGNYYCGPLLVFLSGDFGTLEWNDDVIENDEESDTDENEDMKLDELVFKAKNNYKKLVNDKMKFEKLIEFSTTKFTESDELKDMKKVFEQEFIYKTQNEDDAKSDRNEDEEKSDENLNEHEIKNQPIMEGDESSEDEHMKKEIKDEKLDEGESYDSEETECDNNILGIEDDEDKKREVGKRLKKPSLKLSSPYNKKEVCASKFVDPDEVKVSDIIFSRIGNSSEKVFQTKRGYVLGRGMIETIQPGLWVHTHVIDAWTNILNYEEKLKSNSTVNRYFFDTSMVRQFIFDKNIPFNERSDKFESNIKDALKKDKELL